MKTIIIWVLSVIWAILVIISYGHYFITLFRRANGKTEFI